MSDIIRIRTKTKTGEIEIEDSEFFIDSKLKKLPEWIEKMDTTLAGVAVTRSESRPTRKAVKRPGPEKKTTAASTQIAVPNSFT